MKINVEKIINQYKFCLKCGGEVKYKENNLLSCKKCGFQNFINPTPCSGLLLTNKAKDILLVERKFDPGKGLWDMPGGFINLDETVEESVTREMKEELNLYIDEKKIKFLGSYTDIYKYKGFTFQTLGFVYTGKIDDQEIKPSDDVKGYRFFKPQDIPYHKLAFESLKEAIEKFIKHQ